MASPFQQREKLMKKLLPLLVAVLFPSLGMAFSADDATMREFGQTANSEYVLPANATLIKMTYVGASTQAVLTITNDAFATAAPIGTADLSFDMGAAAYNTLGELCDAVDGDADYTCVLTGGKRDDSSRLLVDVAGSATVGLVSASGGYEVKTDTGGLVYVAGTNINRIGITPEAGKRVVLKYCNAQTDGVGAVTVYGKLAKFNVSDGVTRNDSTLLYSKATANDTAAVHGNSYDGKWMEFAPNEHVVINASLLDTLQTSTSFLQCFWNEK